ncbi:insulin like growth factor binding protein acid labile subunit convoluted [Musca autumnalis]|uniref:insulin like growth factor binding protein acid labile subunit convoluted n=1 Tax=Musca autumnalis TaxID=221902 RepID=UPI003CF84556
MLRQHHHHSSAWSVVTLVLGSLLILLTISHQVNSVYVYGEPKYKCPARPKLIFPCVCYNNTDIGIYVRCDNTNLATLSVAMQNLAALELPVEELTINKGHFERLFGPLFSKVQVRKLTITDTPVNSLDDYVFHGINKTLEELYIVRTNLGNISPLSFGVLGKLTNLEIDQHNFTTLAKNLFFDQYIANTVTVVRFTNGPLNDLPIETFQPLRKLKTLDLHGNQLENLKRNQFKNLRELEILDISFNKIKKLEGQHIQDLTKLGWINASHNALTELSRGAFARNAVLKVLNLSHNKITKLDANSLRGMRFLRRLYLSDNRISDVGRGSFGGVARIGTIDLARNALKKVDYQMFTQLNYIEVLDLAENNITLIEKNSFKDIYQSVINISHNALETIQPKAFENCVNITVLDLSFNRLKNFSKGAFDETTFATEFQLSHNFFTNLADVPLEYMSALKVLNVSYNNITMVPKNTFPKLYELHTIDISHNNISTIFNGVFQTLFSLRFINLSHNSLTEIKSSMFGTLPTLLELDLSNNRLVNIVRGALVKLASCRRLDISNNRLEKLFQISISLNELHMSHNRITKIPAGTWPVMNSLLYLDMSYNLLGDNLEESSFRGLLVLQKLHLEGNGITRPPVECLASMSTLQYLYLQHNNITVLEKSAFGKLPVLFELNLHNNGLTELTKRSFDGLLQLLNLNMSSNALKTIPNEVFFGLPSLRKLDLSHNKISKLDNKTHGVLDDLLSLEELNLSHNRISFVTKKTFPENPYIPYNLKYLDLSYNQMPVLTYDITFGTKKLLRLNLSHNSINELRRGVLGNFTRLQYLDLSNNEISNLQSEPHLFDLPKNLTEIYLQNNQIYRLPFAQFLRKEEQFKIIDLRNNSLTEFPLSLVWNLRNGTDVRYQGNPLHCTCAARPLKHYTLQLAKITEDLGNVTCATPSLNRNKYLSEVEDETLQCPEPDERELYNGLEYDKLSDVRFRDIVVHNGNISVIWFVVTSRDVADFIVFIRDRDNNILYREDFLYNIRKADIPVSLFSDNFDLYREICIISRDSNGETGNWYHAQCNEMPPLKEERRFFFFASSPSRSRSKSRPSGASSSRRDSSVWVVIAVNLLLLKFVLKIYYK